MHSHDFNAHEGLKQGANVRRIHQQAQHLREQERERIRARHVEAQADDRRFSRRMLGVLLVVAFAAAAAAAWDHGKARTAQLFRADAPTSSAVRS